MAYRARQFSDRHKHILMGMNPPHGFLTEIPTPPSPYLIFKFLGGVEGVHHKVLIAESTVWDRLFSVKVFYSQKTGGPRLSYQL